MDKIQWDDSFEIDVEVIDEQHRLLVALMNRLIDVQDKKTSGDDIADVLGEMTNYLGLHFDTEEQLMIDKGYPDIASHREEHQTFVTRTAYFIATYREGEASLKNDLLLFLKEWLVEHILKSDAAFGRYLQAQPAE